MSDEREIGEAMGRAVEHHKAGRLIDAEVIYRHVLLMHPDHADALNFLGVIAAKNGRYDAAIDLLSRSIQSQPNFAGAYNNLGNVYRDKGLPTEAGAAYLKAARIDPKMPDAHNNLGALLIDKDKTEEAIKCFRRAIALKRDYADALFNLGGALKSLGKISEAINCFEAVVKIQPDHTKSHVILAHTLLLTGSFARGWEEYEWRWRMPGVKPLPSFAKPRWNGEPLNGRTILLDSEQGFGDAIQFVRYASMTAERGGRVILQCAKELHRLFEKITGVHEIIAVVAPLPEYDLHCPLLSLPLVFGTRLETIPVPPPYLAGEAQLVQRFGEKLGPRGSKLRVGLVWAGRGQHTYERFRSIPLEKFAPLVGAPNVEFHSLQIGEASGQPRPSGMEIIDHGEELFDFADTAALIENLDLVIAVDTAVAHLAGAMGKETWLLIPSYADWRWLLDRSDSPWYPSLKLFRQKTRGEWEPVIAEVARELAIRAGK